uniref:DUF6824 domain-containing protein n=1 Tax=Craspedostauros australis TaxID=1486917 RepID=A0A7R9WX13_9STRA|mmetsp:Transcript_22747/g.63472  ORF Transcript_22747/g.63472 Transcript_22747/m.63472 type:complete len:268 (+) Transcript_22747:254-1057(+)
MTAATMTQTPANTAINNINMNNMNSMNNMNNINSMSMNVNMNTVSNNQSAAGSIGPDDVLLGRGGATNNHIGNKRYRKIVSDFQQEYLTAKKKNKVVISRRIVAVVHSNGGRFLKRNTEIDAWEEVPHKKATEKTSQALREGLDVRHKTTRPAKMPRRYSDSSDDSPKKRGRVVEGAVVAAPVTPPPTHMYSLPHIAMMTGAMVSPAIAPPQMPELQEEKAAMNQRHIPTAAPPTASTAPPQTLSTANIRMQPTKVLQSQCENVEQV